LQSISSPEAFQILKTFGQLKDSDPVLDGYNLAMKFLSNFQFFSPDMVPPPKLVSRSMYSPTISSRGIFCKLLHYLTISLSDFPSFDLVETSSPKLESYIQDHLISTLSALEAKDENDSSDSDLEPPSNQSPTDRSTSPSTSLSSSSTQSLTSASSDDYETRATAEAAAVMDIDSEKLDVLFLVCVEAMIDTKVQLSDSITVTSPHQLIQLYFQSNLQKNEDDYEWKIEKIVLEKL
jgi:hypothetical protein